MRYFLYAFLFLCLLYQPIALAQGENFLDLAKALQYRQDKIERKSRTVTVDGPPPWITHMPAPVSKRLFKITLLSLDKHSYRIGDKCIFEVQLENITNNSIVIPWSAFLDDVKPVDSDIDPPGYLTASMNLMVADKSSQKSFTVGNVIYGSSLSRGTLKTLRPKESVRIRAPGRLSFSSDDAMQQVASDLPGKVEIYAYYRLVGNKLTWQLEDLISTNSLSVDLKR